jgi:hypothetical protein
MIKMSDNELRERMFREMNDKKIFTKAMEYAFEYADQALDRNVYPTEQAQHDLKIFDEDLQEPGCGSEEVLELLHKFGSPATVSQIGGRYFGMVNGGVIPAGLAAKWLKRLFGLPDETVAGFVSG